MPRRAKVQKTKEPSIPDSELEVLRVLWEKKSATAREVLNHLRTHGSPWTYATVNTLVQRLEAKGLADSDKRRISYVYSPTVSRSHVKKKRVKELLEKLYEGKGGQLVLHLLKSERLSAEEVSEIHELLRNVRQAK